jgi:hypothetical protein
MGPSSPRLNRSAAGTAHRARAGATTKSQAKPAGRRLESQLTGTSQRYDLAHCYAGQAAPSTPSLSKAATCAPHVGAAATVRDSSECRQGPDGAAVVSTPAKVSAAEMLISGMPATRFAGNDVLHSRRMTGSKSGDPVIRSRLRPPAEPRDRDCDQDTSQRAGQAETG